MVFANGSQFENNLFVLTKIQLHNFQTCLGGSLDRRHLMALV